MDEINIEEARIRLECLKVASFDADRAVDRGTPEAILERARMFSDFIFGAAPSSDADA